MSIPGPPTTPRAPARVTPAFISTSIFDAPIDLSKKEGARLYQIGSEALPNTFSGHGKDIRVFINSLENRAKKCNWTKTILEVQVGNEKLNLLKDYGRIPMQVLKQLRQDRRDNPPTTVAEARVTIDSTMMFECIEQSLETRVSTKLLKQATSIDRDGPVMFKQIIDNTFVTTTPTMYATKTELFSLNLKSSKYNIIAFHEDVREKVISLEAVGHQTAELDLIVSLFMAYETSENDLFKLEVRLLKSAYGLGTLSTSDELMEAVEAKYDELVKTDKWKPSTPKEDPNLIALTTTIKSLTDSLAQAKKGTTGTGGNSNRQSRGGQQGAWKYDPSLGTNGTYSRTIEGKEPKTYKWCTGPGHGRKAMWVCGHEPGKCDQNYDRNAERGAAGSAANQGHTGNSSSSSGNTTDADDSIQALRAVLENTGFGDDANAQIQACLALLRN
jgi:hypothetical protein